MNRSDYLSFGGAATAESLDLAGSLSFLQSQGFGRGDLQQARNAIEMYSEETFTFDPVGTNYCDFCYDQIMGGEFERLRDGRDRCSRCSRTVLATHQQFVDEYTRVRRNMEMAFGISLDSVTIVKMVNAKEIAKNSGESFMPTSGVDPRVLGYATKSKDGQALYIENGSPRMAAVATMAHELTHIWQYASWDLDQIKSKYGKENELFVYEGMATWVQIQYLLFIREKDFAARQLAYTLLREDEYGYGFRIFAERYPLTFDGGIHEDSPFNQQLPL